METDGKASTIWRFAHNRAAWVNPYIQTQPLGNVSRDGRFFLFTSDWNGQLGVSADGTPDSAVFIVKLNRKTRTHCICESRRLRAWVLEFGHRAEDSLVPCVRVFDGRDPDRDLAFSAVR